MSSSPAACAGSGGQGAAATAWPKSNATVTANNPADGWLAINAASRSRSASVAIVCSVRDSVAVGRSPFESLRTNGNYLIYNFTIPFVVTLPNHERNCDTAS